jgi:hypothetical protein
MSLSGEPIMILGAFRSGTSSLAAVLVKLGVYFGQEQALYGANEHNPGGHFELIDLQMFDNNVFDTFGMKYYSGGGLPDNWRERPAGDLMVKALSAILNKHFAGRKLYGWKDPSASGLVPVYRAALANEPVEVRYPICIRHPLSVVSSMRKRSGTPAKVSSGNTPSDHTRIDIRMMGVWLYYTLASLKDTNDERRQIFCYENFLDKPVEYVDRITGLLDSPVSSAAKEAAITSIRPEWSHTRFGVHDLAGWPDIVSRTYDLCLRADVEPDRFATGGFNGEINSLWEEWRHARNMLRDSMDPDANVMVAWDGAEASVPLSPSGWTAVSIDVAARIASAVFVNPYTAPCQVWIRKAAWRVEGSVRRANLRATSNGMLEQVYGLPLLTVFGPNPIVIETPAERATLEMEIFVQADRDVLTNLVPILRDQLARLG